jgi:acyl-CoA synthetase (AMP-forming)/AMP-acid ligase II
MNVGIAIARTAKRWPENVAVFDGDRTRTFAQLDERSNRLANALLARGVGLGDRVALLIANRLEVLEVLGGCAKAGAVYCGLNFRLGEEEYEARTRSRRYSSPSRSSASSRGVCRSASASPS